MNDAPAISATSKARFQHFQDDPNEKLRVKLRRVRAKQIQRLFAIPEKVDLATFNRDVWVFESQSLLDGAPIKELYWNIPELTLDQKQRIESALDAVQMPDEEAVRNNITALELHGNYVWGSGTSVYGPMLKDLTQRAQNIQNAAEFLNDSNLTPEDKAGLLKQIPGFGNNIATGLVMLFHPNEYAIYNSQSEEAIRTFGYNVRSLAIFQEAIQDLKTQLGAVDFLELDWFLYQENNRAEEVLAEERVAENGSDQSEFVAASIVPDQKIPELEGRNDQHPGYRTLTERLLERVVTDIQSGSRVGCLVSVGAYYCPAEILSDEIRFDPKVKMDCHYVHMRRTNGVDEKHKVTRRTIRITESYAQQLETSLGLLATPLERTPQYWWVNQGTTYAPEREGQYLWAPKLGQGGRSVSHHTSMASVKVGDWILHYSQGSLRAVSQVNAAPQDALNPFDNHQATWQRDGYLVKSTYQDLAPLLDLNSIPLEWRTANAGPFDKNGGVKQGYLYALSPSFIESLATRFATRFPNGFSTALQGAQPAAGLSSVSAQPDKVASGKAQYLPMPRMVKVAPGTNADCWQDCLPGGYICVGWDDLGDLTPFASKEDFKAAFSSAYPYPRENGEPNPSKSSAKANELWKFYTLQPGDLVAANQGASKILGVGTVLDPAYEWRQDRPWFHNTIRVRWDTTLAKTIPAQRDWPMKTVDEIDEALARHILYDDPLPVSPVAPVSLPESEDEQNSNEADDNEADDEASVAVMEPYQEPSFAQIQASIEKMGLRLEPSLLRRYHLALKTRGFVILSGISGTGKTWLAEAYAESAGAQHALVPVAPNWTTNEDLLGYLNPLSHAYHDTDFSRFLRRASQEYVRARNAGQAPYPFHVILDEMNLARVEYYFAKFLSLMEHRARHGHAPLDLGNDRLTLPPNLFFIGTVNVDETTHGFADKVYDRAQVLELTISRSGLSEHIGPADYRNALLGIWDTVESVAPFAYRVIDEIKVYVDHAASLGVPWQEALDEQLLQKVLPKLKGTDLRLGLALQHLAALPIEEFPRTAAKAATMHQGFTHHGFASFF